MSRPVSTTITPSAIYGQATVAWTPAAGDAGTYTVVLQVSDDGNGDPSDRSFTFVVVGPR